MEGDILVLFYYISIYLFYYKYKNLILYIFLFVIFYVCGKNNKLKIIIIYNYIINNTFL